MAQNSQFVEYSTNLSAVSADMKAGKFKDEAKASFELAAKLPDEIGKHTISKHWVLQGMTFGEFSDMHSGAQFNYSEFYNEMLKVMPDLGEEMVLDESMFCIEFASLVLFTIGPASRQVKEGQRDLSWAMTLPSKDGKLACTIFVSTYKGGPPVVMQPTVEKGKICLTIKQASLIALSVVAKMVPHICNPKKILLTPLAGAIFCKDDLEKISNETNELLEVIICMINESAQSGGFYLPNSTCAAAAVCAVVATRKAETKVAVSIVNKTIKQYYNNKKEMDWDLYDILSKYATGGVPVGMSRKDLVARMDENQRIHTANILKAIRDSEVSTRPENLKHGKGNDDGSGGGSASGGSKSSAVPKN